MTLEEAIEIHGIWFGSKHSLELYLQKGAESLPLEEQVAGWYIIKNWDEYHKEALVRRAKIFASRKDYGQ